MRLVERDGTDVERVRAEAFIEIAEVMGRRGAELTRLRHPDGHDLAHWAARFRLHGTARLGRRPLAVREERV